MIYLDNAATSYPKPPPVAEALLRCLAESGGNPGRASHGQAREASELVFDARSRLAALLSAPDAERIAFTKNATEALNVAILGSVRPGDTVAVGSLEHNAVMRPLRWLEAQRGVTILPFGFDDDGLPLLDELDAAIAARPALLMVTMASNVTGAMPPVADIAARCAKAGIRVGVDASQAVGHGRVSAIELGADFVCFPGHKGLLGPTGTGGLYLAPGFDPEPLLRGGTGSVSESETMPDFLPDRYEAGTLNVLGLAGLLASLSFIGRIGIDAIAARESALVGRLADGLRAIPGVRIHGPRSGFRRAPVLSVTASAMSCADMALELDGRGIAVRAGLHCAPAAHRAIGTFSGGGTVRFSPGFFTTESDIDEAIMAMEDILER